VGEANSVHSKHKELQMKKFASAILALTLIAGVASPAFAAENCTWKHSFMCETQKSLLDTGDDD
jgi:hypothetical protein